MDHSWSGIGKTGDAAMINPKPILIDAPARAFFAGLFGEFLNEFDGRISVRIAMFPFARRAGADERASGCLCLCGCGRFSPGHNSSQGSESDYREKRSFDHGANLIDRALLWTIQVKLVTTHPILGNSFSVRFGGSNASFA
jgi:hypothetical protein